MIGAIVGDIAGSRFEFHNRKTKKFSLLERFRAALDYNENYWLLFH